MATGNHIKHFSAADIERYHKGLLSAKERHDLEKAALDDPFLADALEGYAVSGVNAAADLTELRKRLAEKTEEATAIPMPARRRLLSPALRVAAMIILLVGAGILIYQFAFNKKDDTIVENRDNKVTAKKSDTAVTTSPGSSSTVNNTATTTKDNEGSVNPAKNEPVKVTITPGIGTEEKTNVAVKTDQPAPDSRTITPVAPVKDLKNESKPDDDELAREGGKGKETEKDAIRTRSLAKKTTNARDDVAKEGKSEQPASVSGERGIVSAPAKATEQNYYRNQANTFRGRVTDASNTGVPFANVTNVQDNVGTYTDANGNFTLTSTDSVLNVQVRSLGYDNANTQLRNDAATNRVVLKEDRNNLSEVVISNKKPNATARANDSRKLIEPEPQDGWVKYDSYLANNLNVPEDYQQKNNTENSVQLSFEVDKNGEPVNIRVEKSLCSSCDKEAIRLVKEGPKWKRNASKNGRTTVTINF